MKLPKAFYIHNALYEAPGDTDKWGKVTFEPAIPVKCRIDYDVSTHRLGDSVDKDVQAVLYTDNPATFKRYGKIVYNGIAHEIHKVIYCPMPYTDELHHWEIELK